MERSPEVDAYLSQVEREDFRKALEHLRELIFAEAPDANECISYGMPGYKHHGYLVGFAAFKGHCSFFPGGTALNYADRLEAFKISKGTIQFTPDNLIPEDLVREIVRTRVAQNVARKAR